MLIAELRYDQPDLSTMLDIDQSALTHDPAIPQGIRGQEMRGSEERSIVADDAKAVRDSTTGHLQQRSIVVRRALDRDQTAGIPDFFSFVFESKRGEEQDFDRDVHMRLDCQAIAVRPECDPMFTDRRPVAQGAKAQLAVGRGVGADGEARPTQRHRRGGRSQPQ